ncbi:MAG: glycosyltransferase [Phycisphaerales bacterium]|nr:MAG: glycosyltransferase [Phycisphaerales bacterium]
MDLYYYIILLVVLPQLLFLIQSFCNYHYALTKYQQKRSSYQPSTVVIVPCKGLDSGFDATVASFFNQDYENYLLWFVVEDTSDPAYERLCELKDELSAGSKALDVQIFLAGRAQGSSQKTHNLLHCCRQIADDIEILAFADSDICVRSDWLSHLVWPLRRPKHGASTGYRWFVPTKNNLASLALSAANAKVAQLLGNTRFNQLWGGSMAIRVEVFRRAGIDRIWSMASTDDLSLSRAVKKAGMKVAFVPACLVPSYESTTWRGLFEFGRRQFLITRVHAPATWWFGLSGGLYSVLGLWGSLFLAAYTAVTGHKSLPVFAVIAAVFVAAQLTQAILRQKMISKLLKDDLPRMKPAMVADILGFWVWSLLFLLLLISSAFSRTIRWRGIRYKLLSPTETIIIDRRS